MKTNNILYLLILLALAGSNIVTFCENQKLSAQLQSQENPEQPDTLFLSQWRKEKTEKLKLVDNYNYQIQQLAQSKDSLNFSLAINKDLLSAYRLKTKDLRAQVQSSVQKDSLQTVYHIIRPVIDSLLKFQALSDSVCDVSITNLESGIVNRDSTIRLYAGIEVNLKDIQKQQEQNIQLLTEQLNTAYKNQKKKTRQNKILSGGLLILSGITTALLLTQNAK